MNRAAPETSWCSQSTCGNAARVTLITCTILSSWLLMQVVHEGGHVIGAWWSGGRVIAVDLHPLRISQTHLDPNPAPVFVIWSGPVIGTVVPLGLWLAARRLLPEWSYLFRFFAGWCLVSNGLYLGSGVIFPVGDAHDLLHHGVSRTVLGLFGLVTIPSGFLLWHGQGKPFGRGSDPSPVSTRHAFIVLLVTAVVITVECLLSGTR